MKLMKLVAEDVHGYLPIRIDFNSDVTFLVGLNGAGKTSALRIIAALLSPNLEDLVSIEFSSATLEILVDGNLILVGARRSPEQMEIFISGNDGPLQILVMPAAEMQLLVEPKTREERSLVRERIQAHPIFIALTKLPTPIFLGIDRRSAWSVGSLVDSIKQYQYRVHVGPGRVEKISRQVGGLGGVEEVSALIEKKVQDIRAEQVRLDEELRGKLFQRAFEYKPSSLLAGALKVPSYKDVAKYKEHLATIEKASATLRLPMPELTASLNSFFGSMNRVVDSMQKSASVLKANRPTLNPKKDRWSAASTAKRQDQINQDYINWLINSPQADRVLGSLELLDQYVKDREKLNAPLVRFIKLINEFFRQTGKRAAVDESGRLKIDFVGVDDFRELSALASGERQLLVMLAHLALNPDLLGSGIFMIDEPELSLHIAWQEKFVDSMMLANPDVQFVLATHSPAIVLDRGEKCVDSMVA